MAEESVKQAFSTQFFSAIYLFHLFHRLFMLSCFEHKREEENRLKPSSKSKLDRTAQSLVFIIFV